MSNFPHPHDQKFAWRDIPARGLPKRPASERIADFLEIYGSYDPETAREQAARCIQCPNPSCVSGCPICNPIPDWMMLTAEGKFLEAAAVLGTATNLAEICARMCPADRLCEATCILDSVSKPVSIRALEQFLADHAIAHGSEPGASAPPNGRKVAIIGAGIAALTCADELSRRGTAVTLFDRELVPGGLLVNGVPAFDLQPTLLQRRLDQLKARGVKFELGVTLGTDIQLASLTASYDAIILGFDSRESRALRIPGAELPGVVQAISFLLQKVTAVPLALPEIDVRNQRVAVIGGGDTALQSARAAVRYGASSVTCVCRRTQTEMPCSKARYQSALEENVQFLFETAPLEVVPGPMGRVASLRLARTRPQSIPEPEVVRTAAAIPSQLPEPLLLPGTETEHPVDWVITALGFDPLPCPNAGDLQALARNRWGGVQVDENQMTSWPGVYAAGDIVRGPTPLLQTVRDARRATQAVLRKLGIDPV